MVASLSFFTLALSALTLVSARAIPRQTDDCIDGYLEEYGTFRERYVQLGCSKQHSTPFFDLCCHPMLATDSLTDRDPSCDPANASSSSSLTTSTTSTAEATQTAVSNLGENGSDDECDDGDDSDDADDEDCDGDDESQAPPTSSTADTSSATEQQAAPTSTDEQQPTSTAEQQAPPTSTTEQQAPPTSTTEQQAPPTSTDTPPPTTTTTSQESQPTQSQGDNGNNGGGDVQTGGFATWFLQNNNPGACGDVHSDNDLIAAIDSDRYGNTGQRSELCGKQVKITNNDNGKTVTVTIADACPTCNNGNSIDLSQGAFQQLGDLGAGLLGISWSFV